MKRLGKFEVTSVPCDKNGPLGDRKEYTPNNRVVYQDKVGDYFINWLGDKKRITKESDGSFVEFYQIPTQIQSTSFADLIKKAQETGGMVYILPS